MELLTQEHLAELILYSDAIHDILQEYDFNYNMKMEFNKIDKSAKKIIKFAFGHDSIGELDEWKFQIREFAQGLIENNVKLKKVEKQDCKHLYDHRNCIKCGKPRY